MDLNVNVKREQGLRKTLTHAKSAQLQGAAKLFGLDVESFTDENQLMDALSEVMLNEELLEEVLFQLDIDELELYQRVGKHTIEDIPQFEFDYVLGLLNSGLIYPGDFEDLVLSEDIWNVAKGILTEDYMKQYKLYDEIEIYAKSMVNLYGIVHVNYFTTIYKAFHDEACTDRKILFKLRKLIDEHVVEYQDGFLFSKEIGSHFEEVYEVIKSKSWYLPEKSELLKYETFDYYEENLFTEGVWEILDERTNASNAEEIVIFMQQDIRINGFNGDLINHVLEQFELEFNAEDDFHEFVGLVAEMANHTRQWLNLGYKPVELYTEIETA